MPDSSASSPFAHASTEDDVQALRRRVNELQAQLAAAQRAVQARDEFLSIAAHELRTPMNSLGLQLAAIERLAQRAGQGRLQTELKRARAMLDRYVKRAVALLDVTRVNTGGFILDRHPVDLGALIASVVDGHADEAAFHGVTLEMQVEGPVVGQWDSRAVEEVLSNLLTNAFKYAGGSRVTVRAARQADGWAVLSVHDTGPGIGHEDRERLNQTFERLMSGSRTQGGFGLGLWIVGRFVAAHGGQIEVDTAQGAGSCFTVRLPLAPSIHDQPPRTPT
jgi:two-component system, OmpR family, sensor kinase